MLVESAEFYCLASIHLELVDDEWICTNCGFTFSESENSASSTNGCFEITVSENTVPEYHEMMRHFEDITAGDRLLVCILIAKITQSYVRSIQS